MGRQPGFSTPVVGMGRCAACGREMPLYACGKPRKWCSAACGAWSRNHPGEKRAIDWAPNKRLSRKVCPRCQAQFHPRQHNIMYCSRKCANAAISERYAAKRPTECTEPGCSNPLSTTTTRFRPTCGPCRVKKMPRLDAQQMKAHQRRKTHIRKAKMRYADFTPTQEREMRAKAKRCPLCTVRLIDEPYQPASKELDHIVPLGVGGTHTVGNVRIICRSCNLARPRDGSDYTGPVTLFAMEVA